MRTLHRSYCVCKIVIGVAAIGTTVASATSVSSFTRTNIVQATGIEISDPVFGVPGLVPATASTLRSLIDAGTHYNVGLSATMTRDVRSFHASTSAGGSLPLFGSGIQGAGASGISHVEDRLTITGATGKGTLRLPWHVTGSVNSGYSIAGPFNGGPIVDLFAGADLQFVCTSWGGGDCEDRLFRWNESQSIDMMVNIDIPFTFDVPVDYLLTIALNSGFSVRLNTLEGMLHGHANADFSHTGLLGPAIVLDAAGNAVSNATIVSQSGVDYLAPLTSPSETPEPGSFLLALLGLGVIGRKYRLKRCVAPAHHKL